MKHKTALLFVESSLFLQWVNIAHRCIMQKERREENEKMSALFIKLSGNNTQPANKQQNELLLTWITMFAEKGEQSWSVGTWRGKNNQSWHYGKWVKTLSFEQRKERVGKRKQRKREYEKKVKQPYSASPAAQTMTTTTSSLFLIEKIMLCLVILP